MSLNNCPEWHEYLWGECLPIEKTFKEWVSTTGIGEAIPNYSWEPITYKEFMETVNEVLKDVTLLKEIREEYCRNLEEEASVLERRKEWQKKFMDKMASYFR